MRTISESKTPAVVVLAAALLWSSLAWGLPADAPAAEAEAGVTAAEDTWSCGNCDAENDPSAKYCTECGAKKAGEAEAAPGDPWAGVKISDAYDELRCTYCWVYNELTAARCPSCGHEFAQPSGEYTYPPWVLVPGKGYYKEGTLLEPGKSKKGYWITGIVLTAAALPLGAVAAYFGGDVGGAVALAAIGGGVALIIYGFVSRTEPVYAFGSGELHEPLNGRAYALRSPEAGGLALKVEVTLVGF